MRNLFAGMICVSLLLAGCGGGGGIVTSGSGSSGSGGSGSGGSGSGGSGSGGGSTTAYNVTNAIVDQGPAALMASGSVAANILYVNVTICAPGSTTNCQTIDHVQVDTGSQGLRILASAITDSTLLSALQPVAVGGGSLAECTQFVDGFSWGPLVTADVHIGGADTATTGETAPGIPIQVIGTTTYAVPTDCSNVGGASENTVADFGANGIIGLGLFDEDCGSTCSDNANNGLYYSCTSSACSPTAVDVTNQAINPVFKLAANNGVTDNNGVIIELPAVGATGAANVTGTVVFGIGTQSNNALSASATVLTTDSYYGYVTTSFIGQSDTISYLDSGSNGLFFDDSNIPVCTAPAGSGSSDSGIVDFYCPNSIESFSANIIGTNSQTAAVDFTIANAITLFSGDSTYAAYSNLGGPASAGGSSGSGVFAWGLPFYFGRNVYTAMENTDAGGTSGPYFAF